MAVNPVPQGMHAVTPHLTIKNAAKAIEFYKQAFGATEPEARSLGPRGKIMHAIIQIGNSRLMLNDEAPEMGGCLGPDAAATLPMILQLYVPNADEVFNAAVK